MPYQGLAVMRGSVPHWTGDIGFVKDKLTEPLHWKRPRRIFVNSMSDLFHYKVQDAWIDKIFAVMALSPQHQFQVLTKRPERMLEYCKTLGQHNSVDRVSQAMKGLSDKGAFYSLKPGGWCFPNVWLGVSVEDQKTADERIPILLQTPAAVRWVSYEPALGPVDFRAIHYGGIAEIDSLTGDHGVYRPLAGKSESKILWIVVGGESGPGARPFDIQWARTTIAQCKDAGVAVFMKQICKNGRKIEYEEFPPDLQVYGVRITSTARVDQGVHAQGLRSPGPDQRQ
jgi:protein gp37